MTRRYAILDDNQRIVEERIAELRRTLSGLLAARMRAAWVIGRVADGRVRDESDIDLLLLVLREGTPRRSDYEWWNVAVVPGLGAGRFPVEPTIIGSQSIATDEPNLSRSRKRLKAIAVLLDEEAFADVVRGSQEVVELLLKAVPGSFGLAVPFSHDVSESLLDNGGCLPAEVQNVLPGWCEISKRLRKDRGLAFHGSEDITPSTFYTRADAEQARPMAEELLDTAAPWICRATGRAGLNPSR